LSSLLNSEGYLKCEKIGYVLLLKFLLLLFSRSILQVSQLFLAVYSTPYRMYAFIKAWGQVSTYNANVYNIKVDSLSD